MAKQLTIDGGVEARCRRCGRILTAEKSIEKGIGPKCEDIEDAFTSLLEGAPFEMRRVVAFVQYEPADIMATGIILRQPLADGTCVANIEHRFKHHCPSGFSWGGSGSGAADAALNILNAVLMRLGYTEYDTTGGKYWWAREYAGVDTPFTLVWMMYHEYKTQVIAKAELNADLIIPFWDVVRWINKWGRKHVTLLPHSFDIPEDAD